MSAQPAKPKPHISGGRLWLFRALAAFLTPVLFLVVLEGGLRLAHYGYSPAAIVRYRTGDFDKYCDNIKFSWRFFPRHIAREFKPFTLTTHKNKKTYRIFVAGASAAQGIPDGSYSFARMLRLMLADQYPGIDFEVINTAMTAINSHVVLPVVRDCARYEPDLFVIYLGNNEVVGPYGPGTVFAKFSPNLGLIRCGIALKATRTGQLLADGLARITPDDSDLKSWGGMEMFLQKRFRASDERLEKVYAHFEKNLKDMRRAAHKAGAKVIFCTVGANLKDSAPFASLHRADLGDRERQNWQSIYDKAVSLEQQGRFGEAIEQYVAASHIDDTWADLHFRMATCYWNAARFDDASDAFNRARQLDALRFRADETINRLIRKTAAAENVQGVYLVDFVRTLAQASEHGIASRRHFHEHVHLNFSGNYLLAKALFEQIESILPVHIRAIKAGVKPLLSESECGRYLAYTNWNRYRLTEEVLDGYIRHAPFNTQLYHDQHIAILTAKLDAMKAYVERPSLEISADAYRWAIQQDPSDLELHFNFARLLTEEFKDFDNAAAQIVLVQQHAPHFHRAYTALGQIFERQNNTTGAMGQYLQATRLNPASPEPHYYLAGVYEKLRRYDQAVKYYRRAIKLRPAYVPGYNRLAEMLDIQGQVDRAIEVCRKGLALDGDDALLHGNLGILLSKKGRKAEAIKELETALKLDPDSANIRRVLEIIRNRSN